MKKNLLILMICATAVALNAQVFTEYFDTATVGMDLEDYNGWYVSAKASDALGVSPIIGEESLFYEGYAGSEKGKIAVLDSLIGMEPDNQHCSTKEIVFSPGDTLRPLVGDTMYAAFIVSILPNSKDSWRDFFTWEGSNRTSLHARGRLFSNVDGEDLQFGVSKNSGSAASITQSEVIPGGVGLYHLLVLSYEANEGDIPNDLVSLYINPDPTKPEAEQTNKLVCLDTYVDDYKETVEIKINLRQRGVGALIGGIRVGTDWKEVLQGTPEPDPDPDPTSVFEPNALNNSIYAYGKSILTSGSGFVQVYDLAGRKVLDHVTSGTLETTLSNGIYIVRFKDSKGKLYTNKVGLN